MHEKDLAQIAKAADGWPASSRSTPSSRYAPDAREKLGKARGILAERDWYAFEFYKKREKWQGAAFRLEKLMKDFPESSREPEALWQLADMYVKLSERFKAQKTLQTLIVKYPTSAQRGNAEKLLADLRTQPEHPLWRRPGSGQGGGAGFAPQGAPYLVPSWGGGRRGAAWLARRRWTPGSRGGPADPRTQVAPALPRQGRAHLADV